MQQHEGSIYIDKGEKEEEKTQTSREGEVGWGVTICILTRVYNRVAFNYFFKIFWIRRWGLIHKSVGKPQLIIIVTTNLLIVITDFFFMVITNSSIPLIRLSIFVYKKKEFLN